MRIQKISRSYTGLFNFPDFLHTQQKFPVKQREFATGIVFLIIFSQDIVINSMNWYILGYVSIQYVFHEFG